MNMFSKISLPRENKNAEMSIAPFCGNSAILLLRPVVFHPLLTQELALSGVYISILYILPILTPVN